MVNPQSATLVESVAHALSRAINDPEHAGHNQWQESVRRHAASKVAGAASKVVDAACKVAAASKTLGQVLSVFESSAVPPISIAKYLKRLSCLFRCSDANFVAALVLVDRLLQRSSGRMQLTMWNVHRVFFASLVVAVKYHEDRVFSNKHYASAGGVHLREVNRLERALLSALDFDLRVGPEQYQVYEEALTGLQGFRQDELAHGEGVLR